MKREAIIDALLDEKNVTNKSTFSVSIDRIDYN